MKQEPNFDDVLNMTRNPEPEPEQPIDEPKKTINVLKVKTMSEWIDEAAKRPDPKPLFDSLWCEGCFGIFFAPTNVGKSALAYQIADALSSGKPIPGFDMPTTPRPVLYIDYEMSDKQIELRYRDGNGNHRQFSPLLHRGEIDPEDVPDGKKVENYIVENIEQYVVDNNVKTVIVDNISCLAPNGTEKANDAQILMKRLLSLSKKHELSMLVLAHTPKRAKGLELSVYDLKGSSYLSDLARDIFGMAKSRKGKEWRYIKQLKQTNDRETYGEDNVIAGRLVKNGDALQFVREDTGFPESESEHLLRTTTGETDERQSTIDTVKKMRKSGMSFGEIEKETGISKSTAYNYASK